MPRRAPCPTNPVSRCWGGRPPNSLRKAGSEQSLSLPLRPGGLIVHDPRGHWVPAPPWPHSPPHRPLQTCILRMLDCVQRVIARTAHSGGDHFPPREALGHLLVGDQRGSGTACYLRRGGVTISVSTLLWRRTGTGGRPCCVNARPWWPGPGIGAPSGLIRCRQGLATTPGEWPREELSHMQQTLTRPHSRMQPHAHTHNMRTPTGCGALRFPLHTRTRDGGGRKGGPGTRRAL